MELRRREFLKGILAVLVLAAVPVWKGFLRGSRRVWVRALRGRRYPGPVRPIRTSEVRQIAKWGG